MLMKNIIVYLRNKFIRLLYKGLAKPIFFLIDPEKIHDFFVKVGHLLGANPVTRGLTKLFFSYSDKALSQKIFNIDFKNPIGLAAGFDKDARLTNILAAVGFGHAELGSITGEPCPGNPKPRLWRLKKSKGIIVHYGLKNEGAEKISQKLRGKAFQIPIGISIAKTNCAETVDIEKGIADYTKAYKAFRDIGSYLTINISCPNAFGGEPFTDPEKLTRLLEKIFETKKNKPVFLKIAPGLPHDQIDQLIDIAKKFKIDGFVCTNLNKDRTRPEILEKNLPDKGSISGKPAFIPSNETIKYIYKKTNGEFLIIGCGGIFTAQDAYTKIRLGASLLQLITSMIFEGPQVISEINQGLTKLLKKDGFKNISEAIGVDNK